MANAEIAAWSGQHSAPVVAWQDEQPLNRRLDILLLSERLALALLPADPLQRALAIGLCHEMMGERGIAWNCRLQMFAGAADRRIRFRCRGGARGSRPRSACRPPNRKRYTRGAPQPGATVLTVVEA